MLSNRFAWWDLLRMVLLAFVTVVVCVGLASYLIFGEIWIISPGILLAIAATFYLPFIFVGLACGNHVRVRFELNDEEAIFNVLSDHRMVSRMARFFAPIPGGWRSIAPALFRTYPETLRLPWQEVYCITRFVHEGVVTLSDSWRSVIRLYIPPEQFEIITGYAQARLTEATAERSGKQKRKSAKFYLGLAILTVLAFGATQAWQWASYDATLRIAFLAGPCVLLLVFTWLAWWSNLVAIGAAMLSLWYLIALIMSALGPLSGGLAFLTDIPTLIISALGGCILLGVCIARWFDTSMYV